ncbi:MAG: EamA family transporter [Pseudomonadota bacterium]
MKEWILPTFGAFILWGFWGFIPKVTTRYIDPRSAIVYEVLGGILVATVVFCLLNFRLETHPKGILLAITTGVLGFLGALLFLVAVSKGPVTLVATLSALYPVISITLAVFLLNETVTLKQGVGIVFALIAMILVAT